jgi:hypothetical protein
METFLFENPPFHPSFRLINFAFLKMDTPDGINQTL